MLKAKARHYHRSLVSQSTERKPRRVKEEDKQVVPALGARIVKIFVVSASVHSRIDSEVAAQGVVVAL